MDHLHLICIHQIASRPQHVCDFLLPTHSMYICTNGHWLWHHCFGVQLQLQRNEVIALVNLLNRLSESVKLVHEMGQSAEMAMEGQVSTPTAPSCPLQKIWATFFEGPAPSCPLQRLFGSTLNAPTGQNCPLKRIWASLKQRFVPCWVNLF